MTHCQSDQWATRMTLTNSTAGTGQGAVLYHAGVSGCHSAEESAKKNGKHWAVVVDLVLILARIPGWMVLASEGEKVGMRATAIC